MICFSYWFFVAALVLDAWVAAAVGFIAASLFAASARADRKCR